MSGALAIVYRLTALGLVCGGLLTLGGGRKEILRLGCACLTVVAVLSALQKLPLQVPDMTRYDASLQQKADRAQEELREAMLAQTEEDLARWLEEQAALLQLNCSFSVTCAVDRSQNVTVRQAEGIYYSGPRENLAALRDLTQTQLAVTAEQLIIREATP